MIIRTKRVSRAFDAASSSGMAFLNSQLEFPDTYLYQPLAAVTYARDISVKSGGGFADFLSAYNVDYAGAGTGEFGLSSNDNGDVPIVQATIDKGVWRAFPWNQGMNISFDDLKSLQAAHAGGLPAPFSLQDMLNKGVKLIWNKALDRITYLGHSGTAGLLNNSEVTAISALAGTLAGKVGDTRWAFKTPVDMLNDVNAGLLYTMNNSGFDIAGMANQLLVGWTEYTLLSQPMQGSNGGGGFNSILNWILENNIAKKNGIDLRIFPLPDVWFAGLSTVTPGSRMLFYRNDEERVRLPIPIPYFRAITIPSKQNGGSWDTIWKGRIGQLQWLFPQTAVYMDGN